MPTPPILQLHQALEAVAPIDGVADLGDGTYRIDFSDSATSEQQAAAEELAKIWQPEPEQEWAKFTDALAQVTGFYAAVAQSPMCSFITARMVRLASREAFQDAADPLLQIWNAAPPNLTAEQRAAVQALADAHHLPLAFRASNQIEVQ
ncbi:hypothetical protein [Pseudanabaena sp. FACHB-2040]|uniref:hypothetical protein n=1 Tax=Pseudanabaena sp. FACHB-2040 TaxID=2692859 RepID=UPI0016890644|nr:hypothetical protein [Pseudanabaena sp. FACHB-2040]MBD2261367.1 hypothetical protein [Pseudanabaena sp. FACHB-2040]